MTALEPIIHDINSSDPGHAFAKACLENLRLRLPFVIRRVRDDFYTTKYFLVAAVCKDGIKTNEFAQTTTMLGDTLRQWCDEHDVNYFIGACDIEINLLTDEEIVDFKLRFGDYIAQQQETRQ